MEGLDHAATLDAAIDAILRGQPAPAETVDLRAAEMLAAMTTSIPEPDHRAAIRSTVLLAEPRPSRRRRWFVLAPLAATFAFSGVATAARNAAPGDALYPIRRGMQAVRVAIAVGDDSRAIALLDRAERDLRDARSFLKGGDRRGVRHALEVFDDDMDNARRVIGTLERPARDRLEGRADSLEREAREIRDAIEDRSDSSGSGGDGNSSDDSSGSGSGDDSPGSGSGDDSSGSGSGSGGDDSSGSGSGDDGGSESSEAPEPEGGSDDSSGSGSGDDSSGSGSGGSDDSSGSGSGDD